MNLKEYNEQILRPLALKAIKNGNCDRVLYLKDVFDFYEDDMEMMQAINDRKQILEKIKP